MPRKQTQAPPCRNQDGELHSGWVFQDCLGFASGECVVSFALYPSHGDELYDSERDDRERMAHTRSYLFYADDTNDFCGAMELSWDI